MGETDLQIITAKCKATNCAKNWQKTSRQMSKNCSTCNSKEGYYSNL